MTFSSEVKAELARVIPDERCCLAAELAAVFACEGVTASDERSPEGFAVALGHPAVARKVYLILRKLGCQATLHIGKGSRRPQKRAYRVDVTEGASLLLREIASVAPEDPPGRGVPSTICCLRAYLRGAFLCRGSLSAPEKTYHFEITVDRRAVADSVGACLAAMQLDGRTTRRKGSYVVYLKESEQIVEALKLMGAYAATFELENVRIVKGMRNRVNRLVNGETANVDKTINASLSQLDAIRLIEERVGLDSLPSSLATLAKLRIHHPYASLRELGELMTPRVTKSGVNYRMSRLLAIAKKLGEKEGQGRASPGRNMLSGS